jgi:hypothetical protein
MGGRSAALGGLGRALTFVAALSAARDAPAQEPPPAVAPSPSSGLPPASPSTPAPPAPQPFMTGIEPRPVKLDLGIATEFPIMVLGATTVLEVPFGIQVRADLGWLGSPYSDAINGFLDAVGAYGSGEAADATSQLILAALHNSLVFRPGLGWRPFARHGFEIFGGYTLVALGGSLSGKQAITAVTGRTFASQEQAVDVTINSTLHNFNVGFGWRWLFLGDRLVLRTSGEYLQTLASSTSLTLSNGATSRDLPNISAAVDGYLGGIYKTWVKSPVLSLGLSYRF